ncbi:RDD family protein [Xanthomonas populi]|uniref:RDD family protein n=1 Tax=Xanthomonas populi TaxID=53414 RepID=A0A2S7F0Y5_9XANT|nr:RDD family protein [Xanthomonas populi]PPU99028.1 RDD family protein [Xanthomonas populi]
MTQWYYADAQRERQGPIDTDKLVARLSQGIIGRSSLVWREGLPQWVALREVAAELGLDSPVTAAPEPLEVAPLVAPISDPQTKAYREEIAPGAPPGTVTGTSADTPTAADHAQISPSEQTVQSEHAPLSAATPWPASEETTSAPTAPAQGQAHTAESASVAAPAPARFAASTPHITPLPSAWESPATPSAAAVAIHDAPIVYAGLWRRVAASVLDGFVTTFAMCLIVIPLMFAVGFSANLGSAGAALDEGAGAQLAITLVSYGIGLVIPALYFAWMQSSRHQASLGKLACGIKLVRADTNGGRVGFWRNLLRYVAYALITIFTLGIGLFVSAFMAGLSARKQGLHDKVCETLVVDRWAFTDTPERQHCGLDTVTIVVLAIYAVIVGIGVIFAAILLAAIAMSQN